MSVLQILVETISLGNELLFPLSEALFLDLDLLREALPQILFFLLELGVVQLPWASFAKLPGLHLLRAVGFVVRFLGSVDEIEHVRTDKDRAELLEVAVVVVLNLCNTPGVLATLDDAAVGGLDVLLGTDDGERHGGHQSASVNSGGLIVLFDRGLVDLDALSLDDSADLFCVSGGFCMRLRPILTLCLKRARSDGLRVSALATTGIKLTRVHSLFMTSMSNGLSPWPVGRIKYKQAWTRRSILSWRFGCCSWSMYDSCWSSRNSMMGIQESRLLT